MFCSRLAEVPGNLATLATLGFTLLLAVGIVQSVSASHYGNLKTRAEVAVRSGKSIRSNGFVKEIRRVERSLIRVHSDFSRVGAIVLRWTVFLLVAYLLVFLRLLAVEDGEMSCGGGAGLIGFFLLPPFLLFAVSAKALRRIGSEALIRIEDLEFKVLGSGEGDDLS